MNPQETIVYKPKCKTTLEATISGAGLRTDWRHRLTKPLGGSIWPRKSHSDWLQSNSRGLQDKSVKLDQSNNYLLFCSVSMRMLFANVCRGRCCCVVIYHLAAFYHSSAVDSKLQSAAGNVQSKSTKHVVIIWCERSKQKGQHGDTKSLKLYAPQGRGRASRWCNGL